MEEELFALKWNNHQSTFLRIIKSLRCKNLYSDATLACNGKFFAVHRLVLSTCSDYFGDIFHQTSCRNPVIVLKDIDCKNLEYLLDYMYVGEINVRQNELASLVSVAECLKIKGLAVPDESDNGYNSNSKTSHNSEEESHQRKTSKLSYTNVNELDLPFTDSTKELMKEENEYELTFNKNSKLSDGIKHQPNIKSEPNDFLTLDSEITSSEGASNLNADVDTDSTLNEQYLFREQQLVDECMKGMSGFPGPSHSQLEMQNIDWDANRLGSMTDDFSSQLLNSSRSELPMLLSSGQQLLSSKNIGLKRLKKRFSQLKKNNSALLNKISFNCPHCSYSCNDKSNFKRHVQIHTGEKPYHCPFCRYSCIHSSNLKTHIRNKHADDLSSPRAIRSCFPGKARMGLSNNVPNLNSTSVISPVPAPIL